MRHTLIVCALAVVAGCGDSTSPATPGAPTTVRLISSSTLTGIAGDTLAPITIEVRDSADHPVPGVPIYATGEAQQGPYRPGTEYGAVPDTGVRTDASGRATIRIVAPTYAGPGTIEVGIDASAVPPTGLDHGTVSVPFTTTAGPFAAFASLQLGTRFSGAKILRDSLFLPTDRVGNPASWPAAQMSATNGWQILGDTVVPPNAYSEGSTVVSITAANVTASKNVSVVTDLRSYRWSFQWKCGPVPTDPAGTAPDSVIASGTAGVAYYPGDIGYKPYVTPANATQPAVEFSFTGTITSYRGGVASSGDIMGGEPYNWAVSSQRPDTLVFGVDSDARTLVRTSTAAAPGYVSPTAWCSGSTIQPLTLQAY